MRSFADDIRLLLIVSGVEVKELNDDVQGIYAEEGIAVDVSHAEGEKCARCWKYFLEMSWDPEHPTICKRCHIAI